MSSTKIEQLVQQCKLKDQKAQLSLYNSYSNGMYNVAYRIVQNSYLAEDMVQEAFISAFADIYKLEEAEAFGSWLKKIVVFKSISCLRKEKKVTFTSLEKVDFKLTEETEEAIDITELKATEVYKTICELKENYRLLLTLHYIEGYDYEEIVTITGLSYANCRTTISRAKESLRKKLYAHAE